MTNFEKEFEEKIEKQNRVIIHYIFTVFFSMITAIFTTLAVTGKL